MKILYLRSAPYELNFNSYNLQEIGLAKSIIKQGHKCDVIYYSKQNKNQLIHTEYGDFNLFWRKGFKILRTGIYPQILKRSFLNQYDAIIVSEYCQIMSVLITLFHNNVYLYNGPYYNLFKIPFVERIYDFLFCSYINKKMKHVFCKTKMAETFLNKKGILNTSVVGVGLDVDKFNTVKDLTPETTDLLDKMRNHKNILYVGAISDRKNTELLIKSFNELKEDSNYQNVQLVLIGRSIKGYKHKCIKLVDEKLQKSIIWCDFIPNDQMKYIYEESDMFLLPSIQEIFGMVLLEAMYFSLPVISSDNAGANTLIKSNYNGVIIKNFSSKDWANKIKKLIDDEEKSKEYGVLAQTTIKSDFLWDSISKKMVDKINE